MPDNLEPQNSRFFFDQSKELKKIGKIDEAITSMTKAIELAKSGVSVFDPHNKIDQNNSLLYEELGELYIENYDFDEGIESFHKAMQIAPELEEPYRRILIKLLWRHGLSGRTVEEIEQSYEKNKIPGWYLLRLADCYLETENDGLDDDEKALEYLEKAFSEITDIDTLTEYPIYGIIAELRDRYWKKPDYWKNVLNQAINVYEQIDLKPPDGNIKNILGLFFLTKGDYEKAIPNFLDAIRIFSEWPNDDVTNDYVNLAEALSHCSCDFSEWAIKEYQKALDLDSKHYKARYDLIRLFQKKNLNNEALNTCIEGLNIFPNKTEFLFLFGIELVKKGNIKESMDIFNKTITKKSSPPVDLYEEWVDALIKTECLDEAEKIARDALNCSSLSDISYELLGSVFIKQGKIDEAISFYKKQINHLSENVRYRIFFKLGETYLLKNQINEAIASYEQTLALEPQHYESHKRLAEIFSSKGLVKKALVEYETIIGLNPKTIEIYDEFKKLKIKEAEIEADKAAIWLNKKGRETELKIIETKVNQFEKDLRDFIDDYLIKTFNKNYWEFLKFDKKEVIDDRIKMELLQFPFLEREDINPLDFLLILDYYRLIADTWEIFEKIFRSKSELKDHFHRINSLRNAGSVETLSYQKS